MKNRLTCVIERPLPDGKVLVAVASRDANPAYHAYHAPSKPNPLLLSSKQEFDAADRKAIEAYKEELYASLNADDSESSCLPVGNGKRKNNAHLANPM